MPGPPISEARFARFTRGPSLYDEELLNLRSTVQQLETSLARHSGCCERVAGEVATAREETLEVSRTEMEKRVSEINSKISEQIITSAETHRSEITRVDDRLNSRLSDQNTLLQAVRLTAKKIDEQNDNLRNELADTASRTTGITKGIEQLNGDYAAIKENLRRMDVSYVKLDELDRRLQPHMDDHSALNSDVTSLKAELQAVVSQQESTRQTLQRQADARFAKVDHVMENIDMKLEEHGSHRSSLNSLDTRITKAMGDLDAQLETHQKRIGQIHASSLDKMERFGVGLQAVKEQQNSYQKRIDQAHASLIDKMDKFGVELQAVKEQQNSHQTRLQQGDTRSLDTQKLQGKLQERITALEREVASLVKRQQGSVNLKVTDDNTDGAAEISKAPEAKQSAADTYYDEPSGGVLRYFKFSRKPTTEQKEKLKVGRLFNLKERYDADSVGGYVMSTQTTCMGEKTNLSNRTSDGQREFFTSFQSAEAFLSDGRKPKFKRVKLLLLDTGMDNSKPPCVSSLSEDAAEAFKKSWATIAKSRYTNFVEEEKDTKATDADIKNGHGTHCLGLLLRLIPAAEIHVGRVVTMSGYVDSDAVAKVRKKKQYQA